MSRRRRIQVRSIAGAFALASAVAQAHLVQTGVGSGYDGAAHLFASAPDWLALLALALLAGAAGRAGLSGARAAVCAAPLAWGLGLLLGSASADLTWTATPAASVLPFAVAGAAVAAGWRPRRPALTALTIAVALTRGAAQGLAQGPQTIDALYVVGAVAAVACLHTLATAAVAAPRAAWTRIAVRALGSWLAALGLLMLGWSWVGIRA
ncbi:MAG: HupE/UreJ family protein [Burkholderiales bacterium]|nr:HupE/UreJ family protein [Burkholderiales bacterium]